MTREEMLDILKELARDDFGYSLGNDAIQMAIETLSQEPCEDMTTAYLMGYYADKEPCEDAITRILKRMWNCRGKHTTSIDKVKMERIIRDELPSVNPIKTGHWIQTNEFFINQDGQFIYKFICSECKSLSYFRKSNKKAIGANVCPNCGAKMESREKE